MVIEGDAGIMDNPEKYVDFVDKDMGHGITDPVCRQQLDEQHAHGVSEYKGQKYYFDRLGCKLAFDAEPERWAEGNWPVTGPA